MRGRDRCELDVVVRPRREDCPACKGTGIVVATMAGIVIASADCEFCEDPDGES